MVIGGRARTPTALARFTVGRGVVALVAGTLVLAWPSAWIFSVTVVLGVATLAVGLVEMVEGARRRRLAGDWLLPSTRGLLAVGAGLLLVAWPNLDLTQLTQLVGAVWLLYGGAEALEGLLTLRAPRDGAWRLVRGLVIVGGGAAVLLWPSITVAVLARVVGALLVASGLLCFVSARVLHRAGRTTRDVRLDVVTASV